MATIAEKSHPIRDLAVRTLKVAVGSAIFVLILAFIMLLAFSAAG